MLTLLGSSSSQNGELILYKNGVQYVPWLGEGNFYSNYIRVSGGDSIYTEDEISLYNYSYLIVIFDVINFEIGVEITCGHRNEYDNNKRKGENRAASLRYPGNGIVEIGIRTPGNGYAHIKEIKAIL